MEQTLPEGPIKLGANGMRRLVLGIVFAALSALIAALAITATRDETLGLT